jgi:hypothetical protein
VFGSTAGQGGSDERYQPQSKLIRLHHILLSATLVCCVPALPGESS